MATATALEFDSRGHDTVIFVQVPNGAPTGHNWTQEELRFYLKNPPVECGCGITEIAFSETEEPPVKAPRINCERRIGPVKFAPKKAVKIIRFNP